jgi:hypothetical protein
MLVDPRDWTCGFISRADVAALSSRLLTTPFCIRRQLLTSSLSLLRGALTHQTSCLPNSRHTSYVQRDAVRSTFVFICSGTFYRLATLKTVR